MAYNTKEVVKDVDGNPISQYYNPTLDTYEPVEGYHGANKVIVYDEDGNESDKLDIRPIISTLERLTGTVIDEETRKSNEIVRQSQESDRLSNEGVRISQEDIRSSNEDIRLVQEDSRVSTEQSRVNVESQRVVSESTRVDSENTRVQSELTRETQELDRQSQESIRVDNENSRDSNETSRIDNESNRVDSENTRVDNESNRITSENIRESNESDRLSNEVIRENNESTRKSNETMREQNRAVVEGWIANPSQFNGKDIEYTWRGTELGIRLTGDTTYDYVDLKGETGSIDSLSATHIQNALGYIPLSEDSLPSNLETTTGSQAKANQAEQNAKDYTDSELASFEGMSIHGNEYHSVPYAKESDLTTHLADYANFKNNIEAVKYEGDKLFLKVNGEWVEFKSGSQYPVGNVSDFTAKGDDKQVTLTWQDPADTTIDDSLGNPVSIAKWKGTKILRKTGSYPANENDGVLVVDNGIRDQYKTNGFVDVGLVNDTEYFYMAFPYTEDDVFTIDMANRISATPTEIKIYGIEIDEANSNPETAVVYTDDAVGFTPASGNNGAFNWGSWESIIKDEFMIKPCVLNNPAKTVNYYLDYDNYNLKATGGASNLTGADGDVMTEFGADIYTKWTVVGSKHKIQFSTKPFEGATKNAFETENGYNQFAYYPLLLTQKLFQMIFKNRDGQTALGRGYVDGNSAYATTGNTNTKGFMFGETTGKQQMKFLGIEDYWGNKYQWIDGLVTDASYNLLIGNSGFNDSGSGYTTYSSGVSANTAGYIDTVQGGNDKGFIIKGKAGSETTHYCDYGYLSSGRVARFGGYHSGGSDAGLAQLQLIGAASDASAGIGARLMCVNNGKLYIGAYLGTTQGGKLRSVSGTTPSDNKTISVFRNEAKTNNV